MADERCYVVRDCEGDYWGLANCGTFGMQKLAPRLTKTEAREVCQLGEAKGHGCRIIRLIPKRKPKAPREVFVLVHSHGGLDEDERPRTDRNEALLAAGSVQRVVRYVLAEGE